MDQVGSDLGKYVRSKMCQQRLYGQEVGQTHRQMGKDRGRIPPNGSHFIASSWSNHPFQCSKSDLSRGSDHGGRSYRDYVCRQYRKWN